MIYEITNVEEGDDPEDVLLTISYWHEEKGKGRRPNREPDFVEEHLIVGAPMEQRSPKRTALKQLVALDGSPFLDWKIDPEQGLIQIDPNEVADQIQWVEQTEDEKDDLLVQPLKERAQEVAQSKERGNGRFPQGKRPSPKNKGTERSSLRGENRSSVAKERKNRILGRLEEI